MLVVRDGYKTVKQAETLLAHRANVNAQDIDGFSPLASAAVHGHLALVELLLAHGADVNLANKDGESPLSLAVNNESIAKILLKAHPDPTKALFKSFVRHQQSRNVAGCGRKR